MNSAEHTVFAIENNTLPLGRNAPRIGIVGSKYPIAEINIGDAFNIPVKDDTLYVWANGDWCYASEHDDMDGHSDDYREVKSDSPEWDMLVDQENW
jgi:hypothetical protein